MIGAIAFVLAASLTAQAGQEAAPPRIRVERVQSQYLVEGQTFRSVHNRLMRRQFFSGSAASAVSEWQFDFRYRLAREYCQLEDYRITIRIDITLPEWVDYAEASPADQTRWDDLLLAFDRHEERHAEISIAGTRMMVRAFERVGAEADCDRLRVRLDRLQSGLVDDIRGRQDAFDIRTDHGRRPR